MQAITLIFAIGLLGGVAVGLQSPMANLISVKMGVLESVFIIHLGGMIVAALPLMLQRGGQLNKWSSVPWYVLGAGVFGLVLIGTISYTIPRVGATAAIMLIVAGQLGMALIVDHFGLLGVIERPLQPDRLLGVGILLAGVWLIVR